VPSVDLAERQSALHHDAVAGGVDELSGIYRFPF
jgi:hypothetical protein